MGCTTHQDWLVAFTPKGKLKHRPPLCNVLSKKMLFRDRTLAGIKAGKIKVAFRRWRRPSAKEGGTQKTAVGVISIKSVERISLNEITKRDAIAAGHDSLEELCHELEGREGDVFKIRFRLAGPDPRIELRNRKSLSATEWSNLEKRLGRMDKASKIGPWTAKTLELIATHEGVRAGNLAPDFGLEKQKFKLNVRKLKNLGLTKSLGTGYRISPRGYAALERIRVASARK